jgi:hypothetical protein
MTKEVSNRMPLRALKATQALEENEHAELVKLLEEGTA